MHLPIAALDLSVILPCYRAAPLAHRSVLRLADFLGSWPGSWEVIVVDDGGGDFAPDAFTDDQRVTLIRLPRNRGKGAAVRAGMLAATGRTRVFTDVDLPYDLDLLPAMVTMIHERGFHLVIGDRTLPSSSYISDLPLSRRLASLIFSSFVGTVVTGGFFDTQCGLKALRGDVADALFPLMRLERFAFDVELVYIALKNRIDIHRIPVNLRNNETSSVRVLRDATRGFVDVLRIKWNQSLGYYASRALEEIVYRDFDAVRRSSNVGRHSARGESRSNVVA